MTTYHIDSCNGIECPSVNVVLMLIEKHNWNLRISGVSWKKISHLKQNVVRKYQSEKVWNLSDNLFKLSSFSFLSGYNGNMTSQRVCSSLYIAINPSLSSILFNFADIFISKKLKAFQSLVFLLCNIHTFDVWFLKNVFKSRTRVW